MGEAKLQELKSKNQTVLNSLRAQLNRKELELQEYNNTTEVQVQQEIARQKVETNCLQRVAHERSQRKKDKFILMIITHNYHSLCFLKGGCFASGTKVKPYRCLRAGYRITGCGGQVLASGGGRMPGSQTTALLCQGTG